MTSNSLKFSLEFSSSQLKALLLNPNRPDRSTHWPDRSGFVKRPTVQQPSKTGRTRTRPDVFFQMWFFSYTSFFIYFFSWLLTLFKAHYINIRKNILFFQCRIWNPLVYMLYFLKKKVIFSMWDLKLFCIHALCSQ
jgi:hypothetical protein